MSCSYDFLSQSCDRRLNCDRRFKRLNCDRDFHLRRRLNCDKPFNLGRCFSYDRRLRRRQRNHCDKKSMNDFVGQNIAMVYCDPEESPLVWDYRMRRFIKKHPSEDIIKLFVGHWSQQNKIDLILDTYSLNSQIDVILIDKCCDWWFDNKEIQSIVQVSNVRIVDQPVKLTELIRHRSLYPYHNTCRC